MEVNSKYKLVPPDGGWGYVVALSLINVFTVTVGTYSAFGLVFGDFLRNEGDEVGSTSLIHSIFMTTFCFMGLTTNSLLANYSTRTVGLCGALLYVSGAFLTIFATNVLELIATFGILQGIGYGLFTPVFYTAFYQYFDKKREIINSIAHTALPALAMLIPLAVQYCMETFGYKATVAILFAVSLNSILAAISLHPVQWHSIKVPINSSKNVSDSVLNVSINQKESKTSNLANENDSKKENKSFRERFSDFLAFDMVQDITFLNMIIGISSGLICDFFFLLLTPALLLNRGIGPAESAIVITLFQVADTCSRGFLILLNYFFRFRNRYLLFIGTVILSVLRFAIIFSDNTLYIKTIVILWGVARSWFHVPVPMALAEKNKERFAAAFGWYMIGSGCFSLTLGITIGVISKYTDSDIPTICLLSTVTSITMLLWALEFLIISQKRH